MRPQQPKSSFSWNPANYEAVERAVTDARALEPALLGKDPLTLGIKEQSGLFCPSPAGDAESRYRVGIDREGLPEIQRQDDAGLWRTAKPAG